MSYELEELNPGGFLDENGMFRMADEIEFGYSAQEPIRIIVRWISLK